MAVNLESFVWTLNVLLNKPVTPGKMYFGARRHCLYKHFYENCRYTRNIFNVKSMKKIIIVFFEIDLKSIFCYAIKTSVSVILARHNYLQWSSNRSGTPTLLLIGSYAMGFTIRKNKTRPFTCTIKGNRGSV
jgi:hypothetical protein